MREIAERGVVRVYEHRAGHSRARFEAERDELARRFRLDFGSDMAGEANAARISRRVRHHRLAWCQGAAQARARGAGGADRPGIRWHHRRHRAVVARDPVDLVIPSQRDRWLGPVGLSAHRTQDYAPGPPGPAVAQRASGTVEREELRSPVEQVGHLRRRAIAIDENRADFPRLKWGWGKGVAQPVEVEGAAKPFIQMWFAGNRSDIGGSYPESESRLSDIALRWMLDEARSVPHPLQVDDGRHRIFPSPAELQHDGSPA